MEVLTLEENMEKGRIGEEIIADNINNNIKIYHKIIKNVILENEDEKTEVDIILITYAGIFVIESKNFKGYIFGNSNHKKWTQVISKEEHNQFFNPIMQNKYHIDFISERLNLDKSYFHSYVVFGDNAKLQNITIDDSKTDYKLRVINNDDLIENILLDLHNNDIIISHEQIDKMFIDLNYFYSHLY